MKNFLPVFLMFLCFQLFSQTCTTDPTYTDSIPGVYPPPCYSPDEINCGIDPGVVGEAYEFVFQVVVGDEVDLPDLPVLVLNSVRIDPDTAFLNLPTGLEYVCFPESCFFEQNTLGCVLIYGTPETIAVTDLKFLAEVTLLDGQIVLNDTFPGVLTNGGSYLLDIISDVKNYHYTPFSVELTPNPTQRFSNITIDSEIRNELNLQILNLTGKVIQEQTYQIEQGANQFELDVSELSNGIYFYTIGNKEGVLTDRIIIAKDN